MEEEKNEKIGQREIPFIELTWEDSEDLMSLATSSQFSDFILEESLMAITDALENNKTTAELFNIFNLSVIIEIERPHFKGVLNTINDMFITHEQYERCTELKKLITKFKITDEI
jgi:hypothetical protein